MDLGWYARAGLEFQLTPETWVGANVRHMSAQADLSESLGVFDMDGELYLLTITNRY